MKASIWIGIAAACLALPAAAQNPAVVGSARQAGVIGERYDGYMGVVTAAASGEVRRQLNAVNIRRRNLYIALAARRGVDAGIVGIATACELIPRLGNGEFYMLSDRVWRRRVAGQPVVLPSYCAR
jgi:uncharacterized protein YdbL (DUF1318 family)